MGRSRLFLIACLAGTLFAGSTVLIPGVASAQGASEFSGQFVDTNGNPVPGVQLELDGQNVFTDANGDFTVNVPSGETTVRYYVYPSSTVAVSR
jgi:hypothetical protein